MFGFCRARFLTRPVDIAERRTVGQRVWKDMEQIARRNRGQALVSTLSFIRAVFEFRGYDPRLGGVVAARGFLD